MEKVFGNKKTVHLKDNLKTVNSLMAQSLTLINQSIQDKWRIIKSAVKIVSSSMQMDKNLLGNLEIINFLKVHSRKKTVLNIRELLKMEKNMEEELTAWKVFFNIKDSFKTMSFTEKVS